MTEDPSIATAAALVGVGIAAGVVNTVAGGGSLLTLPVLMLAGLPAPEANATNRVAVLAQAVTASHGFHHAGAVPLPMASVLVLPTLVGAGAGAWVATWIPAEVLEPLLLVVLVAVALFMALVPMLGRGKAQPKGESQPAGPKAVAALVVTGFYGGFFQAGLGFVLLAVLTGLLGQDLLRANALKVVLILPLTVVALVIFVVADLVVWVPGLWVAAGSVIGARVGVHLALTHTEALRWFLLVAVAASVVAVAMR